MTPTLGGPASGPASGILSRAARLGLKLRLEKLPTSAVFLCAAIAESLQRVLHVTAPRRPIALYTPPPCATAAPAGAWWRRPYRAWRVSLRGLTGFARCGVQTAPGPLRSSPSPAGTPQIVNSRRHPASRPASRPALGPAMRRPFMAADARPFRSVHRARHVSYARVGVYGRVRIREGRDDLARRSQGGCSDGWQRGQRSLAAWGGAV